MSKVLVISGHPNLQYSTANKIIVNILQRQLSNHVELRLLDQLYPDFKIDIEAEQQALLDADIIVWQFPINWYALPALLKKWLDDVFTHGFAYGSTGNKLSGKKLILSFTTGSPEVTYEHGQANNYPINDFLPAFRQTATLCGLKFLDYVYSGGMLYIPEINSEEDLANVQQKAQEHAQRLLAKIKAES